MAARTKDCPFNHGSYFTRGDLQYEDHGPVKELTTALTVVGVCLGARLIAQRETNKNLDVCAICGHRVTVRPGTPSNTPDLSYG